MMKAAYVGIYKDVIDQVYGEDVQTYLKENFDFYDGIFLKDELWENSDIEYVFGTWGFPQFTEKEIEMMLPKLKIVFYAGGSVKKFAEPFLKKGIKVISGWQANGVPVAEYVTAQIILANKGFYQSCALYKSKDGFAKADSYRAAMPANYKTKVGLLGMGAIGTRVAKMLKEYDIEVYAYDPYMSEERAKAAGVTSESLEYIFANCSTISNHIPSMPETENMLGYKLLSLMKDNAVFINTGRGAQVIEEDLCRAMREKPMRTAVLDVTRQEPCEDGNELYDLDNVFLTPHIAGSFGNETQRMSEYIRQDAERLLNGEEMKYSVSLEMLAKMGYA